MFYLSTDREACIPKIYVHLKRGRHTESYVLNFNNRQSWTIKIKNFSALKIENLLKSVWIVVVTCLDVLHSYLSKINNCVLISGDLISH